MLVSAALGLFSFLAGVSAIPSSRPNVVGAVYSITNDPQANNVLSSYVYANGTLAFGGATSAKGKGLHGNGGVPVGGDPLFSQDAVKVWNGHLFTVNSASNTVVMFQIDPKDPAKLNMVGDPAHSGGDFPLAIAISPRGQLCVVNGGAISNVHCFGIDYRKGLVAWPGSGRNLPLNQTTPPTGPPGSASDIIFDETGRKLIVSVKGVPPTPGYLATWSVSAGGTLSKNFVKSSISGGGMNPFGMTVIPGRNAIFNADPAIGYAVWNFDHSPATSEVYNVTGQRAICWTAYSPKTRSFYLIDAGASMIDEVVLDNQLKGRVVKQHALPTGSGPLDGAVGTVNGKDFLYVLSAAKTTINVFSLGGVGQAQVIQALDIAAASNGSVAISATNLQGMAFYAKH